MMIDAAVLGQDTVKNPFQQTQLRALVVDPNEQSRIEVVSLLTRQGMDVVGCANVDHGRHLFTDQAMVVAPLNGNHLEVLDFVQWLRTRSGPIQPYVLGVGSYHAPASEWHGFNEFMDGPIDGIKALLSVEAARRWHGWTVQTSAYVEAEASSSSRPVNGSAPDQVIDKIGPTGPIAAGEDSIREISNTVSTETPDWGSLIADITCEPSTNPLPAAKLDTEPGVECKVDSPVAPETQDNMPAEAPEAPEPPPGRLPESIEPSLSLRSTEGMTGALFQQITENSPFGLLLLDDASNVIYANPQHRTILGVSIEEAGGLVKWLEQGCAAEPQQRKNTLDTWWEHVWRRRVPIVLTMRSAEHLLKEIEFRPSILPNDRLIVAIFDVTDARREEESVRTSESRFRSLFLQQPFGVVVVNAGGNIIDASSKFESMAGCSRLDMRRMGLDKFFSEGDFVRIRQRTFSSRKGDETTPITVELLPRHGSPLCLSCQVSTIRNFSGAAVFIAYYFQLLHNKETLPVAAAQPSSPDIPPATAPLLSAPSSLLEAVSDLVLEIDAEEIIHSHMIGRDFSKVSGGAAEINGKSFQAIFPTLASSLPLEEILADLQDALDGEVRCVFIARLIPEEPTRHCEARLTRLAPVLGGMEHFALVIRLLPAPALPGPPPATISELEEPSLTGQSTGILVSGMHLLRQAVILTNERGRITNTNLAAEQLFGYSREELINSGMYKLFLPNQPREFAHKISEHLNRHRCWIGKSTFHRKDGGTGRVAVELVPYEHEGERGFMGLIRELTEEPFPASDLSPEAITGDSNALAQKPVPVVTLHRARNDMQVISSLLSMQASSEGDTVTAREALHDGKDRVGAVALVYRLVDAATGQVDLSRYASELGGVLLRSNGVEDGRISICAPTASAMVNQKLAISLGLLLQELLTSIIKFSFPNQCKGSVAIDIRLSGNEGLLSIKDNGPFQPQELLAKRAQSFGWKVVEALTQQLRAELRVLSDLENEIRICFPMSGADQISD